MSWIEALILGIVQGLTEFLPVSSSGHLELGKHILGVEASESMIFSVFTHGATVVSTLFVFHKDIARLLRALFSFKWNEDTRFLCKIAISCIPILIVAFSFEEEIESLFTGKILLVGCMLLVTSALLAFTHFRKDNSKPIGFVDAFIIGIAQALAIIPGISRSGATIATAILLGNKKEEAARFSFLMVLIPILGKNFLDIMGGELTANDDLSWGVLLVGALAAFISGWIACKLMIRLVTQSKLFYFSIYCAVIGIVAIVSSLT